MKKSISKNTALFRVVFDREEDGRWIAEIRTLPGVMAYGETKHDALQKVRATALRTLADTIEHGRAPKSVVSLFSYEVAHG